MFNATQIDEYREGNRFEVKSAQGGLPDSVWATYSAFANTNGGIILLGAKENKDKSLNILGVSDPGNIIKAFWDNINNRSKVNINILRDNNVYSTKIDKRNVIVIEVPRAIRQDKPIYINGNMNSGTYRRNGEGDYRCTQSEIKNMIRDSGDVTQDRTTLDNFTLDALNSETVSRYRMRFSNLKPNHVWTGLYVEDFLLKIGAIKRSENDGKPHPTVAGLLMFGHDTEIVNEFPNYFLDYREVSDKDSNRWSDRVTSGTGDWSGNLYDFYFRIQDRLTAGIKVPFLLVNGQDRIDDTKMHEALREALANALIHSDYYERRGIVIEKRTREIIISNPGALRIPKDEAMNGGVSDPRNSTLFTMFSLIGIGERAGSGLNNIDVLWKKEKLPSPILDERFGPDRTIIILPLFTGDDEINQENDTVNEKIDTVNAKNDTVNEKIDTVNTKNGTINEKIDTVNAKNDTVNENIDTIKLSKSQMIILDEIRKNPSVTSETLSEAANITAINVRVNISKLKAKGLIERVGSDKKGYWKIIHKGKI